MQSPLVTVMIATRDRGPELERTLELLRCQRYEAIELVVVDDGSREPMAAVIRGLWPEATVIRHEDSKGQCERRNEGFAASRGKFILHLDDDCCFTQPGDLAAAVQYLADRPSVGALVFDLYNGSDLPNDLACSRAQGGCVRSFVGAAVLFRTEAVRQTAGYRSFYHSQGEEDELALQLLQRGWPILFCPWILAHHRLSRLNRNSVASWQRGLSNEIWTLVLHLPARRLLLEIAWKLLVGFWDAIRLARYRAYCRGIWKCFLGVPCVWRLREPFSPIAMRRFDALRLRSVLSERDFGDPPVVGFRDVANWWARWHGRAREASVWEEGGDRGSSHTVRFAHEFTGAENKRTGA